MNPARMRLLHIRDENEAAGAEMAIEAKRFDALHLETSKPRAIAAFNLFQTPEAVADQMVDLLAPYMGPGDTFLEPSAGLGRLYRAMRSKGFDGPCTLVDSSLDCCRELYGMSQTATLKQGDFLQMNLGTFDGVIMNPPFKMWRDIKHIRHALKHLKQGKALVSLCANGPKQNAQLKPMADHWEVLPHGTFKEAGTMASVALLRIIND